MKIALIAGGTQYPLLLAKAAKAEGVELVGIAIKDQTDPALSALVDRIYWLGLGEFGKVAGIFLKERIRNVILAGNVTKTKIFKEKLEFDEEGKKIFKGLPDKLDKSLLSTLVKRIESFGIKVLDSTTFLEGLLPKVGILTKRKPTKEESEDIEFGRRLALRMADLEVGQTVVVKGKVILAIEAIEGTDEAIKRGGELGNGEVVVVKTARPDQDMRYDVPTAGLDTVKSLVAAGGGVLALQEKKTILFDVEGCVELADKNNISIVII